MSLRNLGDVVSRSGSSVSIQEDATIFQLASALAEGRVDAVAVLSTTDGALVGIATSRDVAKCIARGENLERSKVSQIMTTHPVTLPPTETPANALAVMREGRFRHIPVINTENSSVLGIVDVLHLAYDAITRLQVSYSMIPSRRGFDFMRAARETIEKPTLRPVVERSTVATLTRENSVQQACETLAREHLAAIVIVDDDGVLDGIFTCRDVVNRVVAMKFNPVTTRLSQVMTPNPDSASPDYTILESLQRMQACGFRHLPVVENQTRVVIGLVDVLQLASDTLAGLEVEHSSMKSPHPGPSAVNNGRSRGFTSIFSGLFSNSYAQNEFVPEEPFQPFQPVPHRGVSYAPPSTNPNSAHRTAPLANSRRHYSYLNSDLYGGGRGRIPQAEVPLASFKFKDINTEYRRIKVPMNLEPGAFDQFVVDVRTRYAGSSSVGPIKIKYRDEDEDEVLMSNDEDLASCFQDFVSCRNKTILLKIYEVDRASSSQVPSPVSSAASSLVGSPRRAPRSAKIEGQSRRPPSTGTTELVPDEPNMGISRTMSRPIIRTPSGRKAHEAHQRMLDGKQDDAVRLYDEALRLDPDNARAQGGRGAARLISGNSVGAEEDYRTAISMLESGRGGTVGDLVFQMCTVGLVESLIDQRRYEEAVTVAMRIDPASGNTGCTDAFRDELDSASNAAREALEGAEFGDALNCFSNALRVEMNFLKLAGAETARSSLRLGRAKCYKTLEDYDMALEDYEAAAALEPESVAAQKGCGKCFMELEQMERALEAYQRAHKLDLADEEIIKEIQMIKSILPDPMEGKKAEIAKLGTLLGGLKLPGRKS